MDKRNKRKKTRMSSFRSICIILMLLTEPGTGKQFVDAGMAEGLTEGLKYAGQMFGINTAADVADLVAKAFLNAATPIKQKKPNFFSMLFPKSTKTSAESGEIDLEQQATREKDSYQQETDSNEQSDNNLPPAKESTPLNLSSSQILTGVLRMVGFDARKLGALAINVLVMVTHAIGTTLLSAFTRKPNIPPSFDSSQFTKKSGIPATENDGDSSQDYSEYRPRQLRSGSPVDWFLQNPTEDMKRLLSYAIDKKLVEDLIDMLEDTEKTIPGGQNSVACLKMLVCKSSPFIWRMQKSVEKRLNGTNDEEHNHESEKNDRPDDIRILDTSVFSKNLPSLKEFKEHSGVCDQRYGENCRRKGVPK